MRARNPLLRRGLSLLELMLVVVLIAVIASLVIPRLSQSTDTAKVKSCAHNRREINSAIERFGVSTGAYPTSLNDLIDPAYFPDGIPTCPGTGSTYSLNATTHRVDDHTSSTLPGNH